MDLPPSPRDRALDVAKGLAITGIVMSHVLRGLVAAAVIDPLQPWYEEVDTAFYLVHLGVFFLLSGAFVARGVRRAGASAYVRRRLAVLSWLFVVWTLIQGTIQVLTSRWVNTPISWTEVPLGLLQPLGQLWFLPTLAVFSVAVVVLAPWQSRVRAIITIALTLVVSLTWWGYSYAWFGTHGPAMALFFTTGVLIADERLRRWLRSPRALLVGVVGAVVYALLIALTDPIAPPEHFALLPVDAASVSAGVVASIAGVIAVVVASRWIADLLVIGPAFARVGVRSLEIFLAHIIVAAGLRIVLVRLGIDSALVLAAVLTVAAVSVPMALAALAPRLGLAWLFSAPTAWQRLWAGSADPAAQAGSS